MCQIIHAVWLQALHRLIDFRRRVIRDLLAVLPDVKGRVLRLCTPTDFLDDAARAVELRVRHKFLRDFIAFDRDERPCDILRDGLQRILDIAHRALVRQLLEVVRDIDKAVRRAEPQRGTGIIFEGSSQADIMLVVSQQFRVELIREHPLVVHDGQDIAV